MPLARYVVTGGPSRDVRRGAPAARATRERLWGRPHDTSDPTTTPGEDWIGHVGKRRLGRRVGGRNLAQRETTVRGTFLVWIALCMCAFLILAAGACPETASASDAEGSSAATELSAGSTPPEPPRRHQFDANVSKLAIQMPAGEVLLEPGDGDALLLELTRLRRCDLSDEQRGLAEQVRLAPQLTDSTLSVVAEGPGTPMVWGELVAFKIVVRTPAAWSTEGSAPTHTDSPEVRIKTASASVTVRNTRCALKTDTVSGHVFADGHIGRAEINTVDGNITATRCAWPSGSLFSSGGNLHVAPTTLADGDVVQLSSSAGSLQVLLPHGARCRVEADCTAGQVLTDIRELRRGLRYSGRSLRATLGDGSGLLTLRSTTGEIRIEAQPRPETSDD